MGGVQAIITAIMNASGYIASKGDTVVQPESAIEAIKILSDDCLDSCHCCN